MVGGAGEAGVGKGLLISGGPSPLIATRAGLGDQGSQPVQVDLGASVGVALGMRAAHSGFAAIIVCWASFRCQPWRLGGCWIAQVEVRSWPQHEVVVV